MKWGKIIDRVRAGACRWICEDGKVACRWICGEGKVTVLVNVGGKMYAASHEITGFPETDCRQIEGLGRAAARRVKRVLYPDPEMA